MDVKILMNDLKFKFRVSALIRNNGKLLVEQYGKDSLCLPGGYVEMGEDSEKAIIRELEEETGLKFKIENFSGVIENFFINIRGQKTHAIDFYYSVQLNDSKTFEDLTMNNIEEDKSGTIHHHFKWIPMDEIEKFNLLPAKIKEILKNDEIGFHYIVKD